MNRFGNSDYLGKVVVFSRRLREFDTQNIPSATHALVISHTHASNNTLLTKMTK